MAVYDWSPRHAVMQDLGSAAVIPLDFLFDNVLPPIPSSVDLQRLHRELRSGDVIRKNGWRGFETQPKRSKRRESQAFSPLVKLFDDIVESVAKDEALSALLKMTHSPNFAPLSKRANSSRPDGFLELLKPRSLNTDPGKSNWEDIPVSIEFKKSNSSRDVHDNRAKIVWSLHHMMRNDPSRRFAFGITIENTEMRVWFCCRSAVLVSEVFDVLKDHDMVIRLFVSLAFGTTSQLGYDPTVTHVEAAGKMQHEFRVGDATYRTLSVLSNFGADALLGRGTRVFQVYNTADPTRTPRTLKDVWVETDRKREGAILADLFTKIRSDTQGQSFEDARRHFLTVECHGDVAIDNRDDHTKYFWGGQDFPAEYEEMQLPGTLTRRARASKVSYLSSTGGVWVNPLTRLPAKRKLRVPNRAHYRIVFEEVGVAAHSLNSLPDACKALYDAVEGLRLMHAHGYVHRDVSSGNIIFHGGEGKIADLEYAKEIGTGSGHNERTGTVPFIALEVVAQMYLFLPDPSDIDRSMDTDHLMDMIDEGNLSLSDPVSFTYNPLHDLESIWWIATFFIFQHFTIGGHNRQQLDKAVDELFPMTQLSSRNAAFTSQPRYEQMIGYLPTGLQKHGQKLDMVRRELVHAYRSAESNLATIRENSFNEQLYKMFRSAFQSQLKDLSSLAASRNKPEKQNSAAGCEEGKRSKAVESSPSAGKGKMANKQSSMSVTIPRRSTRSRKAVYEQQAESGDDEEFEYAETSKRRKVNDGGDEQGYMVVESSQSARRRDKIKEREGDQSVEVGESRHSARKRKEANEQVLEEEDESSRASTKRKRANQRQRAAKSRRATQKQNQKRVHGR